MKHPHLMWQVRSANGFLVSCLLVSDASTHSVIQYVDQTVCDVEEFNDLQAARERVRSLYVDAARRAAPRPE